MSTVSLVIPGRNCAATLRACLDAVVAIQASADSPLQEIIFVNDGSTDDSGAIAAGYPVTVLDGTGDGPGAARNLGWRHASGDLVWFVDSDCVAEPDALALLVPHLEDDDVAAVGGSYDNLNPGSLLATLIHEEIIERHRVMGDEVDFLATFNVLYRRSVLESLDGFDERYRLAQDAELAFRAAEAGHRLRFDRRSLVAHDHDTRWWRYLRTQRRQGYWRVLLHLEHRGRGMRNAYSSALDHLQPPWAMVCLAMLPLLIVPAGRWIVAGAWLVLALLHVPMTLRLLTRVRRVAMAVFLPMSVMRSIWRGIGMSIGVLHQVLGHKGVRR